MADPLDQYEPIFQAAGREWNVDPVALKAIAAQESGGNPRAVSRAGAQGLMQIMPDTARGLGVTDPYDPAQSIYAGAKYMSQAIDHEGDSPAAALLYYHGGPGWRQSYGPESAGYVPGVAGHYQRYAKATPTTATDATPAPTPAPAKGDAVAQSDDPFTRALQAPTETAASPKGPTQAEGPDPFTQALGTPQGRGQLPAWATGGTGAAPAAPTEEATGTSSPWPWQQDGGGTRGGLSLFPAPAPGALGRIGRAAAEGAETDPSNPLYAGPVGRYLIEPLVKAGGAVFRGGQQFIEEALPIPAPGGGGPTLGRELAALPEAFPTGTGEITAPGGYPEMAPRLAEIRGNIAAGRNPLAAAPPSIPMGPGPRYAGEYYGEGGPGAAAAVPPDIGPVPKPSATGPTSPTELPEYGGAPRRGAGVPPEAVTADQVGIPPAEHAGWINDTRNEIHDVLRENASQGGPSDLSAMATPADQARMTPAQAKAYRGVAELRQIVSPIEGEDNAIYVNGSTPTEAERMGNAAVSQKETMTRQRNPEAFEGSQGRLTQNNAARVASYDELTPTTLQVDRWKEQQQAAAERDSKAMLTNADPVNAQRSANLINGLLNDPRIAEQPKVVSVLKPLRDALYEADGTTLKTDPQAFWGMHDNLQTILQNAKDPMNASSAERAAVKFVNQFKRDGIDADLNDATHGGFRTFLDNQAEYLKNISAAELLQKYRPKLTNAKDGMIQANNFHRFVTDLAVRRARVGIDPAMDVPDNVMQGLINIDTDLKRAGRIDMGKARGSPTNLFFALARNLGIGGAHAAMLHFAPGIGNIVVQQASPFLERTRINRLTRQALRPPVGGWPAYQNPLNPAGAP